MQFYKRRIDLYNFALHSYRKNISMLSHQSIISTKTQIAECSGTWLRCKRLVVQIFFANWWFESPGKREDWEMKRRKIQLHFILIHLIDFLSSTWAYCWVYSSNGSVTVLKTCYPIRLVWIMIVSLLGDQTSFFFFTFFFFNVSVIRPVEKDVSHTLFSDTPEEGQSLRQNMEKFCLKQTKKQKKSPYISEEEMNAPQVWHSVFLYSKRNVLRLEHTSLCGLTHGFWVTISQVLMKQEHTHMHTIRINSI